MSLTSQFSDLPAAAIANKVNHYLYSNKTIVITAPPGAGKSTLLPLTILKGFVEPNDNVGKILLLEPRRIAARHIAERMAYMLGEEVGNSVGYRIRFEQKVSETTRIEVVTEGVLARMVADDATLDGISVVVFDEYHERNVYSDLALALTRQAQRIIRPDLKIVIMSATIDATSICSTLNAPLIESKGRMFPVDIRYSDTDINTHDIAQKAASVTIKAWKENIGDILVFLPGQSDIDSCVQLLSSALTEANIMPLYGNMPIEKQRQAIAPSCDGQRKIVVATPIAETSITIEGVRIVIDSGLYRQPVYETRTGLSYLKTTRISLDMATQRAGRAGRTASGVCYRLWPKRTEHLMLEQRRPEICDTDLAPLVLCIADFGEKDVLSLPWITMPSASDVKKARLLLEELGAIESNGSITTLGKRMTNLPCHPRIAKMIISSRSATTKALACDIAALLESKDIMQECNSTNIGLRLTELHSARRKKQLGRWSQTERIAAEYRRMMHLGVSNEDFAPDEIGQLVAYAYPERIAHSIDSAGGYRMANGDIVRIDITDDMNAHSWIAIASLHSAKGETGKVFLAAPLNIENIDNSFVTAHDNIAWNNKEGCVTMQREWHIGGLLINCQPIHNASKDSIISIVCEAMKKNGLSMMSWNNPEIMSLQQRVSRVNIWHPELSLPDVSTQHLLNTASSWLPLYIDDGYHVKSTTNELRKLDLKSIIWALIPYEKQLIIERLAPTHIIVPTGSRIRIDYREGAEAPVVSVRLQECFGLTSTPCVDDGLRPVLMELLSPGFKPVQLTQDLESFWNGAYFEVRKELRRRYPKHYWPENPLEAEAVKGVKNKRH